MKGVRIERFGQDGWFFLTVEDLPGLFAFGPDKLTAINRLRAAAELLVDLGVRNLEHTSVEEVDLKAEAGWIPWAAARRAEERA
jgi:hypothetical protein